MNLRYACFVKQCHDRNSQMLFLKTHYSNLMLFVQYNYIYTFRNAFKRNSMQSNVAQTKDHVLLSETAHTTD